MAERRHRKSRISKIFICWLLTLVIAVAVISWPGLGSVTARAAEEAITVGTGIKGVGTTPYYASSKNAAVELLYTAADIKNAGGTAGEIDAIAFDVTAAGSLETELLEIYMTQTKELSFLSTKPYTGDLQKVFSGNPTLGKETGWEKLTFGTPFEWDGESNIVIVISRKSPSWNMELRYGYTADSGRAAYRADDKADSTIADISNLTSIYTSCEYRPNIQFTIETCQHEQGKTLEVVEPTCTENGYELFQCAGCGKTVKIHKTSALGHALEVAVTRVPTCTEDGLRMTTCVRKGCDYNEPESIPALGHDWDWENAPIDKNGDQTAVCRNKCGETKTRNLFVDQWEGNWPEPDAETVFSGGAGTAEDPYLISTANDLAQLAVNINGFSTSADYISKYYKQTINIDLNNYLWTPIADTTVETNAFSGNYDGDGFHIDGVRVTNSDSAASYDGLFGYIAAKGHVRHLSVSGKNSSTGSGAGIYIGGIAGYNAGTIEYCVNYINVISASNGAGIAGCNTGTVANCENRGNITVSNGTNANYSYAGGITAYLGGAGLSSIRNCGNYGNITNESTITAAKLVQSGGIAGNGYCNGANITNCFNQGAVEAVSAANANTASLASAGGIVGLCTNPAAFTIENCYNAGPVTAEYAKAPEYALCGQILGNMYYQASAASAAVKTVTISNCFWTKNDENTVAFNNLLPHSITDYSNNGCVAIDEASSYVSDHTELLEKLNTWAAENSGEDLYLPWRAGGNELPVLAETCEHKLVLHPAVIATCTEAGNEAYWECRVCHTLFSDEEGTEEIKAPFEIAATGHKWGEKQVAKTPTYTQAGEAVRTCSVCGEKETSVIAKLEKISIANAQVSGIAGTVSYTGSAIKPAVTVTLNGKKLSEKTDYEVSYSNNKNLGKATVAIKGVNAYTGSISKTFNIVVKEGKTYTAGGMKYKVTNAAANGKGTVILSGTTGKKSKLKKLAVKNTVKIGGKSFKVTAIGANAFKGYTKLTTVTVGKNVKTIGSGAFRGCKSLKKIKITSTSLKKVGSKAISNIYKKAVIKVPAKKRAAYRKLFKTKIGYKKTMKIK